MYYLILLFIAFSFFFLGITEKKVFKSLLAVDLSTTGVDFGLDIRDSAVMWLNDIEHDKAYQRWSTSLFDLLRPTFPGMIRSIRKNLYNLVRCFLAEDVIKVPNLCKLIKR